MTKAQQSATEQTQETAAEEPMVWLLKPAGYKPGDKPPVTVPDNTPAAELPRSK